MKCSQKQTPKQTMMLEHLRRAGLKLTRQRVAVVREIADDRSHPTAQALFQRLQKSVANMSFATVYNTLDALVREGLCSARALSPGPTRFDPNTTPHHHAVCDDCGLVIDLPEFPARKPTQSERDLQSRTRFAVRVVEQTLRGRCQSCQALPEISLLKRFAPGPPENSEKTLPATFTRRTQSKVS